ncbi:hypothetical protein [Sorangium sp. So ce1335]|uniref:hypothetical protein n=1 Tax=Sorangium sp. So ce1335 TaxID=3133335 RepID=UPI003F63927D
MSEPSETVAADGGRHGVLGAVAATAAAIAAGSAGCAPTETPATPLGPRGAAAAPPRALGRTGAQVDPVSLGGEGILRTTGRHREAVPVILEALRLGVR